jgi:hypothetical protein
LGNTTTSGAYSNDGTSWIQMTMPNIGGGWTAVTCRSSDGLFVAVCYSGSCAYSADGIHWTTASMPINANWSSVTSWRNGKFVAFSSNLPSKVAYSSDGINWTSTTVPLNENFTAVTARDDGLLSAVPSGTFYLNSIYSVDGVTWYTATSLGNACFARGVAAEPLSRGGLVRVVSGSGYNAYSYVAGASNGPWTVTNDLPITNPTSLTVRSTDSLFVTVGDGGTAAYRNNTGWHTAYMPATQYWTSVATR